MEFKLKEMKVVLATEAGILQYLPIEIIENDTPKIARDSGSLYISVPFAQVYCLKDVLKQGNLSLNEFLKNDKTNLIITADCIQKEVLSSRKQIKNNKVAIQSATKVRINIDSDDYVKTMTDFLKPFAFVGLAQTYKTELNANFKKVADKISRNNLRMFKTQLDLVKESNIFAPIVCIGGKYLCDSLTGKVFWLEDNELKFSTTTRSSAEQINFKNKRIFGCWILLDSFYLNEKELKVDENHFISLVTKYFNETKMTLKEENLELGFSLRESNTEKSIEIIQKLSPTFSYIETNICQSLTKEKKFLCQPTKRTKLENENEKLKTCLVIKKIDSSYKLVQEPLVEECCCFACERYFSSYIKHLLERSELLGQALLYTHNLVQLHQFPTKKELP